MLSSPVVPPQLPATPELSAARCPAQTASADTSLEVGEELGWQVPSAVSADTVSYWPTNYAHTFSED